MRTKYVVLACIVAASTTAIAAAPKPKLKPTVEFATSWESAVAEAKVLNVPIVVHSHGFYCGPCWGMHASVLQSADYIKFASANTVEVIALSRLDEGRQKGEDRAAGYPATVGGSKVERMVEWPSLTYDEMLALGQSPAGRYNDTGVVPFTCVVDPHDLKEVWRYSGATSAGAIEDAVKDAAKALEKEHGKGLSRKEYGAYCAAEGASAKLATDADFAKALAALDSASKNAQAWPEDLRSRRDNARAAVIAAAESKLAAIEQLGDEDQAAARRELDRLVPRLRGTGLEERAKEIAAALAAG